MEPRPRAEWLMLVQNLMIVRANSRVSKLRDMILSAAGMSPDPS